MNKKASHVDWAISMGIFLVYLIGLFILLRPGVTPVHKPESLLSILKEKFNEEVVWEVREIPIILQEDCRGEQVGGRWYGPEIKLEISEDWKFSSVIKPKPEPDGVKWNNGILSCSSEKCEYRIEKPAGEIGYNVVYYPNKKNWGSSDLTLKTKPETEGYCDKVTLGASISKIGINEEWLAELGKEEYKSVKEEWGFPDDKEFAIYYGEDEDELIKLIGAEETQGVNIFINQFKTQYVGSGGEITIPVIVNLRVW